MELFEDDKFLSSESVKSSQSFVDYSSPNDVKKIIEENYQRFRDIVNQSVPVDSNLEKELAKEDKKCTFMQYKIENLKIRYLDAKEISAALQKNVRDQQMEIEKVSAVIFEQLQQLNIKFPPNGLSQYSDAVSVIKKAGNWVKNLKLVLRQDNEEYDKKNLKVWLQKNSVMIHMSRIQKLILKKEELEKNLKTLLDSISKPNLSSFQENLSLLAKKFSVYQKLKSEENSVKSTQEELKKKEVEVFNECLRINQVSAESLNKYNRIIDLFRKQCESLKSEQIEIENLFHLTMKDLDLMLSHLMQEMKQLKHEIDAKKQKIDTIMSNKLTMKNSNSAVLSQIEQLKLEYSKSEKFIKSCCEQQKISINMKQTVQQQITALETTTTSCKFLLEQLTKEVETLEQEENLSTNSLCYSSVENLQEMINMEQNEVDRNLTINQKLNDEMSKLKQMVVKSTGDNNKLKNNLKSRQTECEFYAEFLENSKKEFKKMREKQIAAIHQGVNNAMKDITNAFSSTFEKELLIDSLREDIQKYSELFSLMQQKVWAANQKNENSKHEETRLQEAILKENEAHENRRKLLEDLEKNSFPKNKIPINWFKSFEKQKQEYDLLVKQRLELEKQRNKLIIEIDNQAFQENKNEPSDDITENTSSFSNKKNVLYDLFKERVRKRRSINPKS